ncbi:MAG: TatD family hydrolase [Thermodesulfobacteriota bacterium]|nr:TatD family hydrolase [Thermodesulfobacteriota bacterium]
MKLFDSHCHLDDPVYDKDFDAVMARAGENDVTAMMIAGVNRPSVEKAVDLARRYPGLYAAVGVHPHDAKNCSDADLKALGNIAADPKVRAWGEIGLDFNRMYSPVKDQEYWFLRQLEMADELGLPVIFHERDTDGRLLEMLEAHPNSNRTGVIHCFSGTRSEMEQYVSLGLHIGITGILTIQKRGENLRRLAPHIPEDRILIETDAPYLTPAPQKNKTRRNEPAFVKSVLLKLAEVRGEDPGILAERIYANTCCLYRIPI